MGELTGDRRADMSISPFEFAAFRSPYIDHVVPTWYTDFTFTFLHPKKSTLRNNFLKPFADDLWWAVLLVGTVFWAILSISLMLEQRYQYGVQDVQTGAVETGLTTVAALSQQGKISFPFSQ